MDYLSEMSQEQAEIERSFAGCVMISPEFVREECGWLDPATFSNETVGKFWEMVLDGDEPVVVANRLGGGPEFFGYMNRTPNFQLARDFANSIAEANYWRQLLLGSQDIVRAIGKKSKSEVEAIQHGICKINVATMLNQAFVQGLKQAWKDSPDNVDPRKWLVYSRDAVKEVVRHKIRLFGSNGQVTAGGLVSPPKSFRTAKLGGAEE